MAVVKSDWSIEIQSIIKFLLYNIYIYSEYNVTCYNMVPRITVYTNISEQTTTTI